MTTPQITPKLKIDIICSTHVVSNWHELRLVALFNAITFTEIFQCNYETELLGINYTFN